MSSRVARGIAPRAGISLKPVHYRAILESLPDLGFFEIHAENYMGAGGPPHRYLEAVRARYPLSVHGVGMSIGSDQPPDRAHLQRLKQLVSRYEPGLVSEHLAWSTHAGTFLNDLLPLPYAPETLARICEHVDEIQTVLGRRILIENPSTYVRFTSSTLSEVQFLAQLASRTGCGLLLDISNVLVSATNHGYSPLAYLDAFPMGAVRQIHLAGFSEECAPSPVGERGRLLIDDHGSTVREEVWDLYAHALRHSGAVPTLIEWDNNVPELPVLIEQAAQAEAVLRDRSHAMAGTGDAHGVALG